MEEPMVIIDSSEEKDKSRIGEKKQLIIEA